MVRGELFRLPSPRASKGREQHGPRYGVVVQADELLVLSTVLVAPTSRRAAAATFRPMIKIGATETRVLIEQTTAVDPARLGAAAGRLSAEERAAVDDALRLVLDLG